MWTQTAIITKKTTWKKFLKGTKESKKEVLVKVLKINNFNPAKEGMLVNYSARVELWKKDNDKTADTFNGETFDENKPSVN